MQEEEEQELTHPYLEALVEMCSNGHPCDVTIQSCDGVKFTVHRTILTSISPFFENMFSYSADSMARATSGVVDEESMFELNNITAELFRLILDYAYTGTCFVKNEVTELLLPAAHFLQVEEVIQFCCEMLIKELTPSNCLGVYRLAHSSCENRLRRFVCQHFKEIVEDGAEFKILTMDELEQILSDDDLHCGTEKEIFESIKIWVEANLERRRQFLPRLLNSVRFHLIKNEYFQSHVLPWCLEQNLECKDALSAIASQLEARGEFGSVYWTELEAEEPPGCRRPHEVLFVSGGYQGYITYEVLSYNIRRNEWRSQFRDTVTLPACSNHGMCELDNLIYIFGGRCDRICLSFLYTYNPTSKTCKRLCDMFESRAFVSACANDGKIYALGGRNDEGTVLSSCERYDSSTKKWEMIAPMNCCRADAAATSFDNRVYVVGGFDGNSRPAPNLPATFDGGNCLDSCEVYDPATDQWSYFLSMSKPRVGLAFVTYHNYLYILGGYEAHHLRSLRTVEKYNPVKPHTWQPVAQMEVGRSDFGAAVYDDMIFAIGGYDGAGVLSSVECYDEDSNRWCRAGKLPMSRRGLSACIVDRLDYESDYFH